MESNDMKDAEIKALRMHRDSLNAKVHRLTAERDAWKAEAKRLIGKAAEINKEHGWLMDKFKAEIDALIVERDALRTAIQEIANRLRGHFHVNGNAVASDLEAEIKGR